LNPLQDNHPPGNLFLGYADKGFVRIPYEKEPYLLGMNGEGIEVTFQIVFGELGSFCFKESHLLECERLAAAFKEFANRKSIDL
jgi:hypothetical protein